jgi:hypothetical protein
VSLISARVKIAGERPLLWHHFSADALPLTKRERTGVAGNDPTEWARTVLMTPDRQLFLEPRYIFGCLREAAKFTKRKRGTLQPYLSATLQVLDASILIDRWVPKDIDKLVQREDKPVYLDVRPVKNPATRGRNFRYRIAASPGWTTTFNIKWEATMVSREEMEAVAIDAGRFAGLGDARTIGFGRFRVVEFHSGETPESAPTSGHGTGGGGRRAKAATAH